jgi:dimethylhistidine N-methyltransferase/ergothioneine biosynthesis protein EgtC
MCRHLAYVGDPVTISSIVLDPPHSLAQQAWAPRRQQHGTMNVDGFGIGWYADGDPVPARYRRRGPIWADESVPDIARVTTTRALLAAVRSASAGTEAGESAAAPYRDGSWLFSLNGKLLGWQAAASASPEGRRASLPADSEADVATAVLRLAGELSPAELLALQSRCDTALVWAMVLRRLRAGEEPAQALGSTISTIAAAGGAGRFNLLLTDGRTITATAAGDSLCYRQRDGGVTVASEPDDDEPGWHEVPQGSVIEATASGVLVTPLAHGSAGTAATTARSAGRPLARAGIQIDRQLPERFFEGALRADALAGLTAVPKSLPPKWFYDERGSELFDKITLLDEYYPTRTERAILTERAAEIATATQASTLVELGSGTAEKTSLLLDALASLGTLTQYVPVDVSESALVTAATRMLERYEGLTVHAVLSDFTEQLGLPASGDIPGERRLIAFLGGTIGNLLPAERAEFLARVRAGMRPGDALLLGTDLVKDPAVLVAAYDDAAGVTADFNKNILNVLNAELGAHFDLDEFEHVALWDPKTEWIEMRLRSCIDQAVELPEIGLTASFAAGEEMRTEVSAKFRRAGVAAELAAAGLALSHWWTDPRGRFGLSLSVPA